MVANWDFKQRLMHKGFVILFFYKMVLFHCVNGKIKHQMNGKSMNQLHWLVEGSPIKSLHMFYSYNEKSHYKWWWVALSSLSFTASYHVSLKFCVTMQVKVLCVMNMKRPYYSMTFTSLR